MIDVPSQSYEIAQTEVTYELWYAVKTWAKGTQPLLFSFSSESAREGEKAKSEK